MFVCRLCQNPNLNQRQPSHRLWFPLVVSFERWAYAPTANPRSVSVMKRSFRFVARLLWANYSYRSAITGLTRHALRAGIQHASAAVSISTRVVVASVAGS